MPITIATPLGDVSTNSTNVLKSSRPKKFDQEFTLNGGSSTLTLVAFSLMDQRW
jgi:hypothetical protein